MRRGTAATSLLYIQSITLLHTTGVGPVKPPASGWKSRRLEEGADLIWLARVRELRLSEQDG